LVQAFLKKWWVESDFEVPSLPLSLRLKGSGCHYNAYSVVTTNAELNHEKHNKLGKIVPYLRTGKNKVKGLVMAV
jgi:hypothetical protein